MRVEYRVMNVENRAMNGEYREKMMWYCQNVCDALTFVFVNSIWTQVA